MVWSKLPNIFVCVYCLHSANYFHADYLKNKLEYRDQTFQNISIPLFHFTGLNFIMWHYVHYGYMFLAVKKGPLCDQICQIYICLYFITLCKLLLCCLTQEQIGNLVVMHMAVLSFPCVKPYFGALCIS